MRFLLRFVYKRAVAARTGGRAEVRRCSRGARVGVILRPPEAGIILAHMNDSSERTIQSRGSAKKKKIIKNSKRRFRSPPRVHLQSTFTPPPIHL